MQMGDRARRDVWVIVASGQLCGKEVVKAGSRAGPRFQRRWT